MISYLKAKKSLVSPNDVQWYVETKEWSKCSESCAGGTVPKFRSNNTSEKKAFRFEDENDYDYEI